MKLEFVQTLEVDITRENLLAVVKYLGQSMRNDYVAKGLSVEEMDMCDYVYRTLAGAL